jgi:hypothetical protein
MHSFKGTVEMIVRGGDPTRRREYLEDDSLMNDPDVTTYGFTNPHVKWGKVSDCKATKRCLLFMLGNAKAAPGITLTLELQIIQFGTTVMAL